MVGPTQTSCEAERAYRVAMAGFHLNITAATLANRLAANGLAPEALWFDGKNTTDSNGNTIRMRTGLCFVEFATKSDADAALARSPMMLFGGAGTRVVEGPCRSCDFCQPTVDETIPANAQPTTFLAKWGVHGKAEGQQARLRFNVQAKIGANAGRKRAENENRPRQPSVVPGPATTTATYGVAPPAYRRPRQHDPYAFAWYDPDGAAQRWWPYVHREPRAVRVESPPPIDDGGDDNAKK